MIVFHSLKKYFRKLNCICSLFFLNSPKTVSKEVRSLPSLFIISLAEVEMTSHDAI